MTRDRRVVVYGEFLSHMRGSMGARMEVERARERAAKNLKEMAMGTDKTGFISETLCRQNLHKQKDTSYPKVVMLIITLMLSLKRALD